MSETVTKAETSKARGVKDTARSHQFPQFGMPQFEFPFRDAALQWLDQSKRIFDAANEEAWTACEKSWSSAAKCMADSTANLAEAMRKNADTAFEIAHMLAAAKSMPEIIEISTTGARRQYETLVAENQQLWSLVQAFATEVMRPLTSAMPKAFQASSASS